MQNPFERNYNNDFSDELLVAESVQGCMDSLEKLVCRHQAWIYNIVLRMVFNTQDAEDITQEILIKIITKLSAFRGQSRFRTWVYRIAVNHVINMKKRPAELKVVSFDQYWQDIHATRNVEFPEEEYNQVEKKIILEEVKIHCMIALLLCLNRVNRLVFILGEIFGVTDTIGSEILKIKRENFRKRLSRSRKKVYGFIREKCGLINAENPCHCQLKAKSIINSGSIDVKDLEYTRDYNYSVFALNPKKIRELGSVINTRCFELYQKQPFYERGDFINSIRELIKSKDFKEMFNV